MIHILIFIVNASVLTWFFARIGVKAVVKRGDILESALQNDLIHRESGFRQQTAGVGKPYVFKIFGKGLARELFEKPAEIGFADVHGARYGFKCEVALAKSLCYGLKDGKYHPPLLGREIGDILDRAVDVASYGDEEQGKIRPDRVLPIAYLFGYLVTDEIKQRKHRILRFGVEHSVGGYRVIAEDPVAKASVFSA